MMRVTDNGGGIDRDDIKTAFVRHATSKIETAMDLMTVGSLGFRGEALSSIASVSQIELITKVHRELLGFVTVLTVVKKRAVMISDARTAPRLL